VVASRPREKDKNLKRLHQGRPKEGAKGGKNFEYWILVGQPRLRASIVIKFGLSEFSGGRGRILSHRVITSTRRSAGPSVWAFTWLKNHELDNLER